MTFFSNSVLNTILILFNSVIPEDYLTFLCLAIVLVTIVGMWKTYCLVKDNVKVPILYVIPIVREIAILCKSSKSNFKTIKTVGIASFLYGTALYVFILYIGSSSTLLSSLALGAYVVSTICFAIFNCYFFIETSNCGRKYLNPYVMFSLYFFPTLTLIYLNDEKNDELEKKKKFKTVAKQTTAKVLVLAIIVNTFLASNVKVYAADLKSLTNVSTDFKVGCDICDNTDTKIILPLLINDKATEEATSCYAITCPECEIFHVIDERVSNVPSNYDYSSSNYYCAFFDLNNTRYKTGNNYDALTFVYTQNGNYGYIDNCILDNKLVVKEKLYTQGVTDGVYIDNDTISNYDGSDLLFPYFLTNQNLYNYVYESYWEGDGSFSKLTSDATEFFPINKNYTYIKSVVSNESVNDTNQTNENSLPNYVYIDNEKSNNYTSNNETYDNKFNVGNFVTKSAEKSLIAVATTGTFALLGAIASPAITTALAVTGSILTVTWLVERGYQLYKVYAGDYSCKEEQEAATYRYLEETTSDLVGLFTGVACYRIFEGLVNTSNNIKANNKTIDATNSTLNKLNYKSDYQNNTEAFDLAMSIKKNGCKPTKDMITKSDLKSLGWKEGKAPSNYTNKFVGGDVFNNTYNQLPNVNGRYYFEADCGYTTGKRGAARLVWSNDGDFYYSKDHYSNFVKLEGF